MRFNCETESKFCSLHAINCGFSKSSNDITKSFELYMNSAIPFAFSLYDKNSVGTDRVIALMAQCMRAATT